MAAITICSDFVAQKKIKSDSFSTVSPSISHEEMGPDAMIIVFWMLRFKPTFSLSSFTFIKRLFSSSSLSAISMVSSAYLRLLIFLPAVLIPAYASSSLVFLMMYSAYKLYKQGYNTQPWRTSFHVRGQGRRPRWATLRGRPGATPERTYPTPEVRGNGQEEQPHLQGAAVHRHGGPRGATPSSRSGGRLWGDTPHPR